MMKQVLNLSVISAKELKNVHFISAMKSFAVVWVAGLLTNPPIITNTDPNGGRNPLWNFTLKFELPLPEILQNRFTLVFDICSTSRVFGKRYIGRAFVPVRQLLEGSNGTPVMKLPVTTPSGRSQGEITFSYEFIDADELTVKGNAENGGDTPAPTTSSEEKNNFLLFTCLPEFGARMCVVAVAEVLSDVVS